MKKYSAAVFLIIVIFLIVPDPASSQDRTGTPVLALQEREFDFGEVKEGSRITHEFTLRNKGTATLDIKKVSPG